MPVWSPMRLWYRLAASDPGLVRLFMAARPTVAVTLATALLAWLAHLAGRPPTEIALGGLMALTAPLVLREPDPRQRRLTLLLLPLPTGLAYLLGALLMPWPALGKLGFLAVIFAGMLVQTRSPRAGAFGFMAFLAMFLALFLHATPETIVTPLLSMLPAVAVVWLVCFHILPDRPARALRHMLAALLRRTEAVLAAAERDHAAGQPADHARLSRDLVRLNETALAAEDLLAARDAGALGRLRRRLVDLELALSRVVGLLGASTAPALRDRARIRLLRARLRQGRWPAHRLGGGGSTPGWRNVSPLGRAVIELDRIAAAIAGSGAAGLAAAPRQPSPRPGPLDWRMALRTSAASGLAILGGSLLSQDRWFWAVITTFVVFAGTRTSGDTIQKLLERMAGTIVGVVAGIAVATWLHGHLALELAALVLGVFVAFYYFMTAYWMTMFCFTIVLGVLYGSAGVAPEPLLLLRLDETAVGAAAALIVALLVLPRHTGADVRSRGDAALRALAEVVQLSVRRLAEGPGSPAPVDAMRRLDASLRDLRAAARPVTVGRWLQPGRSANRATPALLACAHWARLLAARSELVRVPPSRLPPLLEQARRVEALVAALKEGPGRPLAPAMLPAPTTAGEAAIAAALENLAAALSLLSDRLATGTIDAFVLAA